MNPVEIFGQKALSRKWPPEEALRQMMAEATDLQLAELLGYHRNEVSAMRAMLCVPPFPRGGSSIEKAERRKQFLAKWRPQMDAVGFLQIDGAALTRTGQEATAMSAITLPERKPAPPMTPGLGVAGNFSSTIRPTVKQVITANDAKFGNSTIGDRIARESWSRACYLLDASYLVCSGPTGARWRSWSQPMFSRQSRRLPLFLDSGAYRRHTKTAPRWFTWDFYLQAIELIDPDGFMAFDVVGDMSATLQNYQEMLRLGLGNRCIPVWQIGPTWDDRAGARIDFGGPVSEAARAAIGNARRAVQDPALLFMAEQSRLIAIGGMVQGPCPREVRHIYLAELCRLMPDHQFWGLGQASQPVVNGLGPMGLLDRVWLDGSWWIHHARTEQIAVVQDGLLKNLQLTYTGAESFFTFPERASANIRSLLGAYDGKWVWPDPAPLPTDMTDMDAVLELKRRIKPAQMDLWELLGADFDKTGTEAD